jgi:hypothetical protein
MNELAAARNQSHKSRLTLALLDKCRSGDPQCVESRCGAWFRWSLSVADSFVCRCLTSSAMLPFLHPLIEPDVRICRIRLSEKTHAIAEAIASDAVCNC